MIIVSTPSFFTGTGGILVGARNFKPLLSPEVATVFKHVPAVGMKGPKTPFPGFIRGPRYLHEAVVKRQGMPEK